MLRNNLKCIIGTLLLTVAWSMTSCSRQQTVYANYAPIDDTTWEKTDTITFDVPPVKAAGTYQEKLGLRLADDFPFLALSMDIEIQVQPKGILHRGQHKFSVIDQGGNPKGKGLSLQQYTFDLGDLELEEGDSLHISMAHNMKREILPGVVDLGIILIKK
jgi:gliding motility-associated lipoprotein GldH